MRALIAICFVAVAFADEPKSDKKPTFTDPAKAGPDFLIQGEYRARDAKIAAQVIALGDGHFEWRVLYGGLPGDGWDGKHEPLKKVSLNAGETKINFGNRAEMEHVVRMSPTLAERPHAGAIVLFDGTNVAEWDKGELVEGNLLKCGTTSKRKFKDFTLHVEFRLPFMPKARGQDRANSGVYLHGRYEIQILDSFGLEGKDNECGGIYKLAAPKVNMCFPPLTWQTYDIDFTAAKFDTSGKKTADAVVTVRHNGVVIHDKLKVKQVTDDRGGGESPEPGPIYLQDHGGDPVVFRNIWVVERK